MIAVKYRDIVRHSGAGSEGVDLEAWVADLTIDSREVKPEALFVALPGSKTHGHHFVPQVWQQGGVALVEDGFGAVSGPTLFAPSPLEAMGRLTRGLAQERQTFVVAITGSVGKTSVKELTAAVLGALYPTGKSQGNYNTAIGIPLSYFRSRPDMTHFVAEMGMRALGEIAALTEIIPPDVAVITNIGPNHLETLGTMKNIQRAKGEILQGLGSRGTAVLNRDDELVRELAATIPNNHILWYGTREGDAVVKQAVVKPPRTEITWEYLSKTYTVSIPWVGSHHGLNVAAAFLAGIAAGMAPETAARGLGQVDPGAGRLQVHTLGGCVLLADYYNASPRSVSMALDVLQAYPAGGRKVAVLGDMLELGGMEEAAHRETGQEAARRADVVLAVGPRARDIQAGARDLGAGAVWAPDLDEAYGWLSQNLRAGDAVLLKASHGMMFETLHERLGQWGGPH